MGARTDERRRFWDARHSSSAPIEAREPNPALVALAGGLTPGRALDLGCGDGTAAVWLANHGWSVTGLDISPVAIERAAGRAAASGVVVDWLAVDALDATLPSGAFDLVTLLFFHLPAQERRILHLKAAAAVSPGGTLLVVAHDRTNLADGVGGPQDPALLPDPSEIAEELPGLTVTRAEVVRRPSPNGAAIDGRVPLDAVVVAIRPDLAAPSIL